MIFDHNISYNVTISSFFNSDTAHGVMDNIVQGRV